MQTTSIQCIITLGDSCHFFYVGMSFICCLCSLIVNKTLQRKSRKIFFNNTTWNAKSKTKDCSTDIQYFRQISLRLYLPRKHFTHVQLVSYLHHTYQTLFSLRYISNLNALSQDVRISSLKVNNPSNIQFKSYEMKSPYSVSDNLFKFWNEKKMCDITLVAGRDGKRWAFFILIDNNP